MKIKMRVGWVRLRGGKFDYAAKNTEGCLVDTHPFRLVLSDVAIRSNGRRPFPEDLSLDDFDVVKLLDPWDEGVPEEHRKNRFVVGECFDGYETTPCVFDRKTRESIAYERLSVAEEICVALNLDHGRASTVIGEWSKKEWARVPNEPTPDIPNPTDECETLNADSLDDGECATILRSEPFAVVDPPSRTSRTLQTEKWTVYAEQLGDAEPKVMIDARSPDASSVADARALVAAILAVCDEIEADHRKPAE